MWLWVSLLLFQSASAQNTAAATASTPANAKPGINDASGNAARVRAQMADSLAKQRASIQKQMSTVNTYAKPATWLLPPLSPVQPSFSCEPIAEPELGKMIEHTAQDHQVSPDLVREVARQESGFRPCAISRAGAVGLMQLMPATQIQFQVQNPLDAQESLTAGTKLLKQLLDKYNGDVSLALGAYNAGSSIVDRVSGIPDFPETQNYVSDILQRLQVKAPQPVTAPAIAPVPSPSN